jgi:hypothetical protein
MSARTSPFKGRYLPIFTLISLLLTFYLSTTRAEFVRISNRQTPEQRQVYFDTASKRYGDRLEARAEINQEVLDKTLVKGRAEFTALYSQRRIAQYNNKYSVYGVDDDVQYTPREEYVAKWGRLSESTQNELIQKRERLLSQYKSSSSPWLSLNTQDVIDFALRGPRPYWLWLTLTALDSTMHCPTCVTYHNYWKSVTPPLQQSAINNPNDPLPIVMAVVQPSQAKEIWRALQLNRAPVSVLLPPEFDLNAKVEIQNLMSSGVLRQTMMMNPSMEDLINPLATNGFKVELPPPPQPGFFLLLFVFAVMAGILYGIYRLFNYLLKLQTYRVPFIILTLVFYLWAAAGGGFVKSNSPPRTSYAQGLEIWVSREYTQMLGMEFYSVMALHLITALGLFSGVVSLAPFGFPQKVLQITTPVDFGHTSQVEHDNEEKGADGNSSTPVITSLDQSARLERRISYKIFGVLQPDLLFAIGFGLFFVGYYALLMVYKVKMPSYPFGF